MYFVSDKNNGLTVIPLMNSDGTAQTFKEFITKITDK